MLNSNKNKKATRAAAAEDQKQKWCNAESSSGGYHGYYTGRHCPLCGANNKKQ